MFTRRSLLAAAGAAALPLPAFAQGAAGAYPTRPVSLLVGFAPGGGTDIIARLLHQALQEDLGQPIAIENRAGGSGTIAAATNARGRPDGYQMLMTTVSASAVVPPTMRPPPFDIIADQTAVVLAGTVPLVAVVPLNSPAQTFDQFIAHAKANPGKLNYSSSGVATQQHLAAAALSFAAGLEMTHIPFRGTGQAVNEVLAGRIDIAIDTLPTYLPHIRAGRVRALATTLQQRVPTLPDVPTVAERGFPDFDAAVWYMVMGPPGLPSAISERWVQAVNKALSDPGLRQRVADAGFIPGGGTSADAAALLRRDAAKYAEVIRRANITFD
jgi:tripartite-type tricarboxylate transporter receptor subunit TctC